MRDVAIENVNSWMTSPAAPARFESSSDIATIAGIWQFSLDQAMKVAMIAPPNAAIDLDSFPCGKSAAGRMFLELMGVERNVAAVSEFTSAFRAQERIRNARFIFGANGLEHVVIINASPVWNEHGEFDGYNCTATDISKGAGLGGEINDYEVVLGAFIRHVPNLITVKDVEGKFMAINPLGERTYGLPRAKLIGKRPHDILPSDIAAECAKQDNEVLESETVHEVEQTFPSPEGARTFHTVKFPIFDADRYLVGIGSIGVDITDHKRTEDGLYKRANFDTTTGLPNRNLMIDRLDQMMAISRRSDAYVGVVVLDLGDFTALNEGIGHVAADWLLIDVASTLKKVCRETDTVCRLEGDTFAIVASTLKSPLELDLVAEKVLKALQAPRILMEEQIFIQPSIGTAVSTIDATSAKELVHCAKLAMDMAKDAGRGRIMRFKPAISSAFVRRMKIESQLRGAVARNEFTLAYQPIVDVKTDAIVGAEALLRWKNDDLGFVSPAEFIPVAEEAGLIPSVGAWVIRRACEDAKKLNPAGAKPLVVSFNMSIKQLADKNIVDVVASALKEFDVAPHLIKIEMTESAFADDQQTFQAAVQGFRNLGVNVALDDFGTGYSSLSYLHRYRFDQLKIDKSFTDNIAARGDGYLLVENIIRMAHSLRLEVVAEGVESAEQVNMLRELGCDKFQGYFISKPVPLADFTKLLSLNTEFLANETNLAAAA